jgi:hypothetical protein
MLITAETLDGRSVAVKAQGVRAVRIAVAEAWGWPTSRTRLALSGTLLSDGEDAPLDALAATTASKTAAVRCWLASACPPSARASERTGGAELASAARDLLAWSKEVPLRTWLGIVSWLASARLAGSLGFGNPYVLLSMFALVFFNLGERKQGDLSAYNVFNDNFTELLGQLRAEHLEADIIDPNRIAARARADD